MDLMYFIGIELLGRKKKRKCLCNTMFLLIQPGAALYLSLSCLIAIGLPGEVIKAIPPDFYRTVSVYRYSLAFLAVMVAIYFAMFICAIATPRFNRQNTFSELHFL